MFYSSWDFKMSLPPSVSRPSLHMCPLPLLHPLHPYLFPPCPTFTIIISAGRLLPLDSIFNVSCALISTQTLLQAYVQRWGKGKFDRRWKGRHGTKDKLAKLRRIDINDGNRLLGATHRSCDRQHPESLQPGAHCESHFQLNINADSPSLSEKKKF